MEEKQEPHEELAEIMEQNENLNGETPVDLNAAPEEPEKDEKPEEPEPEQELAEEEVPSTSEDADKRFEAMLAAKADEVAKRQRLEGEMDAMRQEMARMRAENQPAIDPFEDPEGYQRQQNEMQSQRELNQRISMSEMIVKAQNEDYDEVVSVFSDAARTNPALTQAMFQSEIPAKFAYDEGKRIIAMKEIGDNPQAYKESLREQIKAEVLAELKEKQAPDLPKTIANAGTKAPAASETSADDLASLLGEV